MNRKYCLFSQSFYSFPSPIPKLEGPLRANEILRKAERWFEGNITGPESFAVDANGKCSIVCYKYGLTERACRRQFQI